MKPIYLKNTLTRKKETFEPIKKKKLGFYSCGPTVYFYPHIGNMRSYIFNDLIKRIFQYNGYEVKHIMNLTDVGHLTSDGDTGEDKIEVAKRREGKNGWEIAKFYTNIFKNYSQKLNILPPNKYVPATSQIKAQIKLIKILDAKGFLYKTSDGLYFDTSKLSDYGKLTGQDLSQIKAGARIEMSEEKKNPTDFSVWKFSPTDKQRDMEWASPWGKGFPGWHLECSVISTKYLGQPFDLHTGGIEHIPIHHTNEIAQSEAAYDKPLANYWVHFEHLLLGQNKMAKSSGQALTLESLHEQGYEPLVFRYFVLQTHYSKKQEFSWEALAAARSGYNNLKNRLLTLPSRGKVVPQYKEKFIEAINNDFNIAQGLAVAWDLLKDEAIAAADKKATWLDFDRVFGLGLKNLQATPIPPEIAKLAEERWSAKQTQDWEKADKLRQKIDQCGYIIDDTKDHYTITKK